MLILNYFTNNDRICINEIIIKSNKFRYKYEKMLDERYK